MRMEGRARRVVQEQEQVVGQQLEPRMEGLDDRAAAWLALPDAENIEVVAAEAGEPGRGPQEHASILRQLAPSGPGWGNVDGHSTEISLYEGAQNARTTFAPAR